MHGSVVLWIIELRDHLEVLLCVLCHASLICSFSQHLEPLKQPAVNHPGAKRTGLVQFTKTVAELTC